MQQPLQVLKGHADLVHAVAFSPDGRLLASGSRDGMINFWNPESGSLTLTFVGHSLAVQALAFSPDGRSLASIPQFGAKIKLWNSTNGKLSRVLALRPRTGEINSVQFSPDGTTLATLSGGLITFWDTNSWIIKSRMSWETVRDAISWFSFSGDRKLLALVLMRKALLLWDCAANSPHQKHECPEFVFQAVFSPVDNTRLALLCLDGDGNKINIWDVDRKFTTCTMDGGTHHGLLRVLAFSPDGSILASMTEDGQVHLWNPGTGSVLAVLPGYGSPFAWLKRSCTSAVAFNIDGKLLASISADKTVRLWEPEAHAGGIPMRFEGHEMPVFAIKFSPSGGLASASLDTIYFWDPATGKRGRGWPTGHLGRCGSLLTALAFSPDEQHLAAGLDGGTIIVWDIDQEFLTKGHRTLPGRHPNVIAMSFSLNNELLASLSGRDILVADGKTPSLRLWNLARGTLLRQVELQVDPNLGTLRRGLVGFSPDSSRVIAIGSETLVANTGWNDCSFPCHVWIWDVQTGNILHSFSLQSRPERLFFDTQGLNIHTHDKKVVLPPDGCWSRSEFPLFVPSGFGGTREWLKYKDQELMWLPPAYRPRCSDSRDALIAFGHESGRVTFIELDETALLVTLQGEFSSIT